MKKITVKIDGMRRVLCGTKRRTLPDVKKVSASRKSGETMFLSENSIDEGTLKNPINDSGYTFVSISSDEFKNADRSAS